MRKQKGRSLFIVLCVAPAVILFIIFMVIPTINIFRMSLFKWGGYSDTQTFVGFDNFVKLFQDERFFQAFQNTILLIVLVTIITFAFSLVFAGILSRSKIKGQNFFRIVFYIPNIPVSYTHLDVYKRQVLVRSQIPPCLAADWGVQNGASV